MKLLLDANLSPTLRSELQSVGYSVAHVDEEGLLGASDDAILAFAAAGDLVVITADSDFAAMLALTGASRPSVVHLRGVAELPRSSHLQLLVDNLPNVAEDLESGAIVSLSPSRLAVRRLPIHQ